MPTKSHRRVLERFASLALAIAATPACATLTVAQQAAVSKVQVITAEPATNCQNLGIVTGSRESDGPGGTRAKAVILGANTVHVDPQGVSTAFYCPDAVPAEVAGDVEPTP